MFESHTQHKFHKNQLLLLFSMQQHFIVVNVFLEKTDYFLIIHLTTCYITYNFVINIIEPFNIFLFLCNY